MTNMYKIPCAFLLLTLFSCSDDDVELPRSEPDFNIAPAIAEVGVPVMFDNLTLNASRYEWDFGDTQTSEETSPSHTYDEAGTFMVTLKAYTNDNQMDSVSKEVTVGQRILTGINIESVAFLNGKEENWDPVVGADSTKYPDLIIIMSPVANPGPENTVATPILTDIGPGFFPVGFNLNPDSDPLVFTNEDWSLTFLDFDGDDPENPAEEDFEPMNGFEFNPVTLSTSFVNEEGLGFMQLALGGYQVNLLFEIR